MDLLKVEYTMMITYSFKFLLTLYSHASDACINVTNFMKNLTKGQIFKIRKTKTKKTQTKGVYYQCMWQVKIKFKMKCFNLGWFWIFLSRVINHELLNRPFALKGHVTLFLWKWKLYDFAFEKRLVGHILNKIIVIWFFKPTPFP